MPFWKPQSKSAVFCAKAARNRKGGVHLMIVKAGKGILTKESKNTGGEYT